MPKFESSRLNGVAVIGKTYTHTYTHTNTHRHTHTHTHTQILPYLLLLSVITFQNYRDTWKKYRKTGNISEKKNNNEISNGRNAVKNCSIENIFFYRFRTFQLTQQFVLWVLTLSKLNNEANLSNNWISLRSSCIDNDEFLTLYSIHNNDHLYQLNWNKKYHLYRYFKVP